MSQISRRTAVAGLAAGAFCAGGSRSVAAAPSEIVVTHYGAQLYGAPYTIAREKGWFKEAALDLSSITSSKGGSTAWAWSSRTMPRSLG